jgi:putative PIN family toxin of toxin-antitoxin system
VRCVIDPGVLVAGVITPIGPPAEIVRRARTGAIEIVMSPHLLGELASVLARRKLRRYVTAEEASEYVEGLARIGISVAESSSRTTDHPRSRRRLPGGTRPSQWCRRVGFWRS